MANACIPDVEVLRDALRQVIDPEIGINIVDLGLVVRIEPLEESLLVEMTMTSPACPLGSMMSEEVAEILRELLPDNIAPDVRLVSEPAWDPSRMSEQAKRMFGWKPDQNV